ncbi:MAG: hypothetical protein WCP91_01990 [Candidatus Berkelbacteria bacterium]
MKYLIIIIISLVAAFLLNSAFNNSRVSGIEINSGWDQYIGEKKTSEPVVKYGFPLLSFKMWDSYGFEIPAQSQNHAASLINFFIWFALSFFLLSLVSKKILKK